MFPEQTRALEFLDRKGSQATTETLRAQLRHAFTTMEDAFARVEPHERELSPGSGKWSAIEILDHLAASHGPAVPQLRSLLAGSSPGGVAIPADLQTPREQRGSWEQRLADLQAIHRELLALVDQAHDDLSLEATAVVEMVVKVPAENGEARPVHWHESLDWKAFVQVLRGHTLQHRAQLDRALEAVRGGDAV